MAYGFYRTLTVDHTKVSADQANFAVLVTATDPSLKSFANGGKIRNTVTQSGGAAITIPADLVFSSDLAGTSKIPWEIEAWDQVTGRLVAWARVNISASLDVQFYMVFADVTVATQQNAASFSPANVWTGNYQAVYHLSSSAGSVLMAESTGSFPAGVNVNGVTPAAGKIDTGALFVLANSKYIDIGSISFTPAVITVELWANGTAFPGTSRELIAKGYESGPNTTGWEITVGEFAAGKLEWSCYNGTKHGIMQSTLTLSASTWYHIVGVYDGAAWVLYINGALDKSVTDSIGPRTNARKILIGAVDAGGAIAFFDGVIDEVRISSIARPASWVATQYNAQNSPGTISAPGFLTFGSETSVATATDINFDFTTGTLPSGITFTRASTGTFNNASNVLATAGVNTARFNYIGGVSHLLIEPSATNVLLFSNAFTSAGWSVENAAALTAAQFVSPDGTNNGWSNTSGSGFGQVVQQVTLNAGPYTCSTWIKQISGGGDGWLALGSQFSPALPITSTIGRKTFASTPGAGSRKFGLNGGNGAGVTLGIFGGQIESGSVATSYIPTGASAATRAIDVATFVIPAGVPKLVFTFDDNSTQTVTVSPGSYTIPATLNRPNIKTIVGAAVAGAGIEDRLAAGMQTGVTAREITVGGFN